MCNEPKRVHKYFAPVGANLKINTSFATRDTTENMQYNLWKNFTKEYFFFILFIYLFIYFVKNNLWIDSFPKFEFMKWHFC